MRYIVTGVFFLAGCYFGAQNLHPGAYLNAVGYFLTGVLAAVASCVGGRALSMRSLLIGLTVVCGIVTAAHVRYETPGSDFEQMEVQASIVQDISNNGLPASNLHPWAEHDRLLLEATLEACGNKNIADLGQTADEANDAVHLGPKATLLNTVIHGLDGSTKDERWLSGFKELLKLHPAIFVETKKHPEWLSKHGFTVGQAVSTAQVK